MRDGLIHDWWPWSSNPPCGAAQTAKVADKDNPVSCPSCLFKNRSMTKRSRAQYERAYGHPPPLEAI